jgi:hypothetical protein
MPSPAISAKVADIQARLAAGASLPTLADVIQIRALARDRHALRQALHALVDAAAPLATPDAPALTDALRAARAALEFPIVE